MHTAHQRGFTLIELSIVLVIIGLIAGGVLVGRDLIKAAEVRSTISQIEKYNTAVRTFQGKYGALPGDLPVTQAATFGLYHSDMSDAAFDNGDGNGLVEGTTVNGYKGAFAGEIAMFFPQLSQAGLIEGSYGTNLFGYAGNVGLPEPSDCACTGQQINSYLPPAKVGGNYFVALADVSNGSNYFILTGVTQIESTATDWIDSTNVLPPQTALAIDLKMDDGLPATGRVFAIDTVANSLATRQLTVPTANGCVSGAKYVTGTGAAIPQCSLRFDFQ